MTDPAPQPPVTSLDDQLINRCDPPTTQMAQVHFEHELNVLKIFDRRDRDLLDILSCRVRVEVDSNYASTLAEISCGKALLGHLKTKSELDAEIAAYEEEEEEEEEESRFSEDEGEEVEDNFEDAGEPPFSILLPGSGGAWDEDAIIMEQGDFWEEDEEAAVKRRWSSEAGSRVSARSHNAPVRPLRSNPQFPVDFIPKTVAPQLIVDFDSIRDVPV